MIEILIMLATIAIASSASGKKNDESEGEDSKTFSSSTSGYDSNRQVWWTRHDMWKIDES